MTGTQGVATGYFTVMLNGDYTGTVTRRYRASRAAFRRRRFRGAAHRAPQIVHFHRDVERHRIDFDHREPDAHPGRFADLDRDFLLGGDDGDPIRPDDGDGRRRDLELRGRAQRDLLGYDHPGRKRGQRQLYPDLSRVPGRSRSRQPRLARRRSRSARARVSPTAAPRSRSRSPRPACRRRRRRTLRHA